MTKHFGEFCGCSFFDYERLRIQHISSTLSKAEPALFNSKWWDYRFLHPTESTYLFAEHYKEAFKRSIERRVDLYQGRNSLGLASDDFLALKQAHKTGMWRARQRADAYGIPYEVWCAGAMIYAEKNLWKNPPTPSQLYVDSVKEEHAHFKVSMVDFIRLRWAERNEGIVRTANSDFYKLANWSGHPYQKAHLIYVKRQIISAANPAIVIAELIKEKQILSEDLVRIVFGAKADGLLKQASAFY